MIFKQWEQVLDGTKTQTRRIIKSNELASGSRGGGRREIHAVWIDTRGVHDRRHEIFGFIRAPLVILESLYRLKWAVAQGFFANKTYAIQPGRGKKAVGRICITKIRRERLQPIIDEDVEAEGICLKQNRSGDRGWSNGLDNLLYPRREWAFKYLWNSINKKPGTRWADNPEVWTLEFEVVEEVTDALSNG